MADVKIINIDGEQWNIKDQDARKKITTIEENISTQELQYIQPTMKDGYTCKLIVITNHYKVGKIHFATMRVENLSGSFIGTIHTANIASINITPKKSTSFIMRDYLSSATARFSLEVDGAILVSESNGIDNGRNIIIGEIIFAEP